MDVVRNLVVVAHLIGMAAIVGGWLSVLAAPRVTTVMVWGARAQIVTGLLMVGLVEAFAADGEQLDHAKVGVKLLIGFVVAGLAEATLKRGSSAKAGAVHAVGGLALLNVAIAVLWG